MRALVGMVHLAGLMAMLIIVAAAQTVLLIVHTIIIAAVLYSLHTRPAIFRSVPTSATNPFSIPMAILRAGRRIEKSDVQGGQGSGTGRPGVERYGV